MNNDVLIPNYSTFDNLAAPVAMRVSTAPAPVIVKRKPLYFSAFTGVVFEQQKFAETHVSGSVSGGHGTVSSSTTRTHEFWLRSGNGQELPVKLMRHDIPVAIGQTLTMVFGSRNQNVWEEGTPMRVFNHAMNRSYIVNDGETFDESKLALVIPAVYAACAALSRSGGFIEMAVTFLFAFGITWAVCRGVRAIWRLAAPTGVKRIKKHLDEYMIGLEARGRQ